MREGGPEEKKWTANVGVEREVKGGWIGGFDTRAEDCGAGVVDDNVDFAGGEGGEGSVDDVGAVGQACGVGLDGCCVDAEGLELLHILEGVVSALVVVDYDLE